MLEDVEDEGRDEHLATRGGSSQHATSLNMSKPRFHIFAGFLGRSRKKGGPEARRGSAYKRTDNRADSGKVIDSRKAGVVGSKKSSPDSRTLTTEKRSLS